VNPTRLVEMASAFYESSVLFAASDLGLFAMLAGPGEADARTIAESCGLDRRGTRLLLDACTAVGLLIKEGDSYRNSPEAAVFLVPGSPSDLSGAIRYNRDVYSSWGKLKELVKTGKPVERPELHLGEDPERTRTFVLAMHGRAMGIGQAVIPMLELTGRKALLDVGGGPGTYSILIARAFPHIKGTVLDLPDVVRIAGEIISQAGVGDRVRTLAGDYHTLPFPADQDAIIFFGVLHQEDPASIRDLLQRAYRALIPGGSISVLDMMTDASHTRPKFSALFALNMALTTSHGWVFSEDELKAWLVEAGFTDFNCRPLSPPMPHWLATARKA
jgi:ubiquinone/menaquinone biosynthesis C-methylase UbiE